MNPHDARGGANDQFFSSFIRYGFVIGPHLRIFMMLIGQRPDRHHGTTLILVIHNLGPDIWPQIGAQEEALSPMIGPNFPVLVLKHEGQVELVRVQLLIHMVPVPVDQLDELFGLFHAFEVEVTIIGYAGLKNGHGCRNSRALPVGLSCLTFF